MGSRNVFGRLAAGLMAAALVLVPATGISADVRPAPAAARPPLAGKIVGIDPGHNGLNYTSPAFLNRKVWNGREWEGCDTTGTRTAGGYTEARFTWNVAVYLRADLIRMGARVVMTRTGNHGLGPVADGPNTSVIGSSLRFGRDVHAMMLRDTPLRVGDYYGLDGYIRRDDLAGLNLTTMPKVLIETGNMSNAADTALLVSPGVQRAVAAALAAAIARFLAGR